MATVTHMSNSSFSCKTTLQKAKYLEFVMKCQPSNFAGHKVCLNHFFTACVRFVYLVLT